MHTVSESNGVMMQYFRCYTSDDDSLWRDLATNAKQLVDAGISALCRRRAS